MIQNIESDLAIERIFTHRSPTVFFFAETQVNLKGRRMQPFFQSAKFHRGKAAFVFVNMKGPRGKEVAEYFSIKSDRTLLAVSPVGEEDVEKYLYTGAWNQDDVRVWVQTFLDGKLERHFKSEEIPPATNAPVKTIVGKNYEEIVHKPNSHVLVEFYAPWCHHCKKVLYYCCRTHLLARWTLH